MMVNQFIKDRCYRYPYAKAKLFDLYREWLVYAPDSWQSAYNKRDFSKVLTAMGISKGTGTGNCVYFAVGLTPEKCWKSVNGRLKLA